jgi:hypothetical protein
MNTILHNKILALKTSSQHNYLLKHMERPVYSTSVKSNASAEQARINIRGITTVLRFPEHD